MTQRIADRGANWLRVNEDVNKVKISNRDLRVLKRFKFKFEELF